MSEIKYEIIKKIGLLSKSASGWAKELNLISWNDREPKYDIRDWSENHEKMGKGVTLSQEELSALRELLNSLDSTASVPSEGKQEQKGDIPQILNHVLTVYDYVSSGKFDYNDAVAQITKEQDLKSIHTVYDACTRQINLNTEQFRVMLENPQQLTDHLIRLYPQQESHIRKAVLHR
jgi:hypothetical protein